MIKKQDVVDNTTIIKVVFIMKIIKKINQYVIEVDLVSFLFSPFIVFFIFSMR